MATIKEIEAYVSDILAKTKWLEKYIDYLEEPKAKMSYESSGPSGPALDPKYWPIPKDAKQEIIKQQKFKDFFESNGWETYYTMLLRGMPQEQVRHKMYMYEGKKEFLDYEDRKPVLANALEIAPFEIKHLTPVGQTNRDKKDIQLFDLVRNMLDAFADDDPKVGYEYMETVLGVKKLNEQLTKNVEIMRKTSKELLQSMPGCDENEEFMNLLNTEWIIDYNEAREAVVKNLQFILETNIVNRHVASQALPSLTGDGKKVMHYTREQIAKLMESDTFQDDKRFYASIEDWEALHPKRNPKPEVVMGDKQLFLPCYLPIANSFIANVAIVYYFKNGDTKRYSSILNGTIKNINELFVKIMLRFSLYWQNVTEGIYTPESLKQSLADEETKLPDFLQMSGFPDTQEEKPENIIDAFANFNRKEMQQTGLLYDLTHSSLFSVQVFIDTANKRATAFSTAQEKAAEIVDLINRKEELQRKGSESTSEEVQEYNAIKTKQDANVREIKKIFLEIQKRLITANNLRVELRNRIALLTYMPTIPIFMGVYEKNTMLPIKELFNEFQKTAALITSSEAALLKQQMSMMSMGGSRISTKRSLLSSMW
jgi:hypothetical protein